MPPSAPTNTWTQAEREIRFGVVLYGGVSLTIYINGVTQELLRMVRSTTLDAPVLAGTEKVYRRVAQILGDCGDQPDCVPPDAPVRVRFLVDVIAGTSAGGINGVFLGKALSQGESLDAIKQLWIDKGNIDTLLNDRESVHSLPSYELQKPATSLLNSQAMYVHLLKALETMDKDRQKLPSTLVADDLDVYITATDLEGLILPLQLADQVVFERRHKAVFHFQHSNRTQREPSPGFTNGDNPQLAFAARCTSSFPVAFEPMVKTDTAEVIRRELLKDDSAKWDQLFADFATKKMQSVPCEQNAYPDRSFSDGGYLDNKPFSYVIEQMDGRYSNLPMTRKLIYIEPDPEDPTSAVPWRRRPDAVMNGWLGLSDLPRYETIREDLQRVIARNEEVRRMKDIRQFLRTLEPPKRDLLKHGQWQTMDSRDLALLFGDAYVAYHRLKVSTATDFLIAAFSRYLEIEPGAATALPIKELVRAWRDREYGPDSARAKANDKTDQYNEFLNDYSVDFRVRRLRFLLTSLDELLACGSKVSDDKRKPFYAARRRLYDAYVLLRELQPRTTDFQEMGDRKAIVEIIGKQMLDESKNRRDDITTNVEGMLRQFALNIDQTAKRIREGFQPVFHQADQIVRNQLDRSFNEGNPAVDELADLLKKFYTFEDWDARLFPTLFNSDVQELSEVEIIRVSPTDAKGPQFNGAPVVDEADAIKKGIDALDSKNRRKLKGAALGAFGGFLDEEWRRNDLIWGRLDGAERLISSVLSEAKYKAVRQQLIAEAHLAILSEEMPRNPLVLQSTAAKSSHPIEQFVEYRRLLEAVPQKEESVNRLGRSMKILSEVADNLPKRGEKSTNAGMALQTAGQVTLGLAALASQRRIVGGFSGHWLRLLYLVTAVLILIGFLYSPAAQTGWILLICVGALHVGVGLMRDFLSGGKIVQQLCRALAGFAAVALITVGALAWPASFPALNHYRAELMVMSVVSLVGAIIAIVCYGRALGPKLKSITDVKTVGDVQAKFGELGDEKRLRVRQAMACDSWLVVSYAVFFVTQALLGYLIGTDWWKALGVVIGLAGLAAAVSDMMENVRIDDIASQTLRELSGSTIIKAESELTSPPGPATKFKWLFFTIALLATIVLWVSYCSLTQGGCPAEISNWFGQRYM